jgi:hypothetical protein
MRALAKFAMRGRMSAALVAAAVAMISLLVPPLSVLSAAVVALVTLRRGPAEGLVTMASAAAGTALLAMLALGYAAPAISFLTVSWAPAFLLGWVLRRTVGLGITLEVGALLVLAGVLGIHLFLGDPVSFWKTLMEQVLGSALLEAGIVQDQAALETVLASTAVWMTGFVLAAVWISAVAAVLLARFWQAQLYNPGGFRIEFHSLKLHRAMAISGTLVAALALLVKSDLGLLARDWVPTIIGLFALVGMALVHSLVDRAKKSRYWLFVMYLALALVPPQALMLLAALAVVDTGFDLRSRVPVVKE